MAAEGSTGGVGGRGQGKHLHCPSCTPPPHPGCQLPLCSPQLPLQAAHVGVCLLRRVGLAAQLLPHLAQLSEGGAAVGLQPVTLQLRGAEEREEGKETECPQLIASVTSIPHAVRN